MKYLSIFLGMLFPVLLILIFISNCGREKEHDDNDDTDSTEVRSDSITVEPADTAEVIRQAEDIGETGNLKITLLWDFEGDIDLYVAQPNNVVLFYNNEYDYETGGKYDVDNRAGGRGAAENIYWENPPKGKYDIALNYYGASSVSGETGSGTCTVVVFQKGKSPQTYRVNMDTPAETIEVASVYIE